MMNESEGLLVTIQGRKGEELTSAVLKYLLMNSPEYYQMFLELIGLSPTPGKQLPCKVELEWPTKWKSTGCQLDGRLDLLIDTGAALIGIENKIWAAFSEYQPLKYCESLLMESSKIYGAVADGPILVVLVPAAKESEAKRRVRKICNAGTYNEIRTVVCVWTDLLDRFRSASVDKSRHVQYIFEELRAYVNKKVWFPEPFSEILPRLFECNDPWNDYQKKLIGYLWYVFPESGRRLHITDRWLGYNFFREHDELYGWYGFVKSKLELIARKDGQSLRQVEFVIHYGQGGSDSPSFLDGFGPVEFNTDGAWMYPHGWVVDVHADWDNFLKWSEALAPAIEAIGQMSSTTV